jgi:hypothetical protein
MLERPTGNAEVIGLLEYWLEQARKGDLYYVALAAVKDMDQVAYDYAGAKGLEDRALGCLTTCAQELETLINARRPGPRNYNLDASYVEWDCVGTPVCWDYLIWLVDAEMTRRRLKGPPPLRIHFSRVDELDSVSRDFFENVFRPLLPLIGAIEDVDAKGGRHKPLYVPYDIVIASKAGEFVPRLAASDRARDAMNGWLHGTEPITITLREAPHWTKRNSNLGAWLKFAKDLEGKGENVIFIRDTFKATEPLLPGFATCPIAAWNVDLRMALYEHARCNLFISNGPAGLGLFSDRPYLYFVNIKRDAEYPANTPGWWKKSNGVADGEQWPWALPTQRMIWQPDTYENISEAWEKYGTASG